MAKKSNILPLVLVGGAAVAAFIYFKNKTAAAKAAAPEFEEVTPEGEATAEETAGGASTETGKQTTLDKLEAAKEFVTSLIPGDKAAAEARKAKRKAAAAARKAARLAKRKKRKKRSSTDPFANVPLMTPVTIVARRKKRRIKRRRRVVKGFDDLSVLY